VIKDNQRKWKNISNVERGKNYRKLRKLLTGNTEKPKRNTLTAYKAR
jgi:hypothetical protein